MLMIMSATYDNLMQLVKRIDEADIEGLQNLLDDVACEKTDLSRTEKIILVALIQDKLETPRYLN